MTEKVPQFVVEILDIKKPKNGTCRKAERFQPLTGQMPVYCVRKIHWGLRMYNPDTEKRLLCSNKINTFHYKPITKAQNGAQAHWGRIRADG